MAGKDHRVYTRDQLLFRNFEARCVGADGAHYVWHNGCGLRVDSRTRTTTLITDTKRLPEGPWFATELGEEEIGEN